MENSHVVDGQAREISRVRRRKPDENKHRGCLRPVQVGILANRKTPPAHLPAHAEREVKHMRTLSKDITNQKDHLKRHKELHKFLDELVADFIEHTDKRPSTATVIELMQWSSSQAHKLDHSHTG